MDILSPSKKQNLKLYTAGKYSRGSRTELALKKNYKNYSITCKLYSYFAFLKFIHLIDIKSTPMYRVPCNTGYTHTVWCSDQDGYLTLKPMNHVSLPMCSQEPHSGREHNMAFVRYILCQQKTHR